MAEAVNCSAVLDEPYDEGLHIAAVFVILVASAAGACFPGAMALCGKKLNDQIIGCMRLFAAGVITATAFVHMLPPAFEALGSECLGDTFAEYDGAPGAIALSALCFTMFLQSAARDMMSKDHKPEKTQPSDVSTPLTTHVVIVEQGHPAHGHSHGITSEKDLKLATIMLEIGIASHSVLVGVLLGVSREDVGILLGAISVHQFMDGLALATMLQSAKFRSYTPGVVMVILFSLSTPIGIIIGILVHHSFNENDKSALVAMGTLDALAAGVLIYDALVNIIAVHLTLPAYRVQRPRNKFIQFFCLWCGAGIMAFLGKYA